jgi:hypothetical protein
MKTLLIALALIPAVASAWTSVTPNSSGGFSTLDSDGSVTQVVPAPGGGYTSYGENGFTTYEPSASGGINYYGTEGRNGFITPGPTGDGFTVYDY